MTRRCAEIKNGYSTYIFFGIIPLCNFQYRNRVHSITLIPFEIILQNLVEIYIIPLSNFPYRNCAHSITLIPFDIISSPEHEVLMVSYCDQSLSVVRRASCVVRRQQFVLKANSS